VLIGHIATLAHQRNPERNHTMFMHNANAFAASRRVDLPVPGIEAASRRTTTGLLHGSLVETSSGWRRVETVRPGMSVGTYDGGFRTVTEVRVETIPAITGGDLVHIPGGVLGNCTDLVLPAAQNVMIESHAVELVLGDAAVLVPAAALVGLRGIERRMAVRSTSSVCLSFGSEEIIFVNSGLMVQCPAQPAVGPAVSDFRVLDAAAARALAEIIADGALTSDDACNLAMAA
jgi:hypothetical protein